VNFNDKFSGHKNLLITQDEIGQSCKLFFKPRVCQSLLKMPNPARPLVPLPSQVWLQSPLMRGVGTRGFWNMHSHSFEQQNIIKDGLRESHESRIHKREEHAEECIWKTEGKWFYTKPL